MERRRPRDHFTRVLKRICERLDGVSEAEVRSTGIIFKEVRYDTIAINSLWVVGSYARGSFYCGDLDIVIEAASKTDRPRAWLPPTSAICRTFFKSPADVRVYVGTPEKNTSGVAFEEARLVWSRATLDWTAAIDAIRPDPNAKRFHRPTDAIPFRVEQLDVDTDAISDLLELQRTDVLRWEFVPFTVNASEEPVSEDEADFRWLANTFCGKQTQRLVPHLIQTFRRDTTWPKSRWLRKSVEKTEFRNGGCDILVGRPSIPYLRLDKLTTSQIALCPHLTQRGPNGAWFLDRGDTHPLVTKANDIRLYCLVDDKGYPDEVHCIGSRSREGTTFDLFSTQSEAALQAQEDEKELGVPTMVREVTGRDLLALLSRADVLYLDDMDVAITHAGRLLLETDEISDTSAVFDALKSFQSKQAERT